MELDERERESLSSPSRKKHRSASPDEAEENSKRRKHHHQRRHHHHRHHRHGKKGREREEGDEGKEMVVDDADVKAGGASDGNQMAVDQEVEEGEIVEEGENGPDPELLQDDQSFSDREPKPADYESDALCVESKPFNACDSTNHKSSGKKIEPVPFFMDGDVSKGKGSVIEAEREVSNITLTERDTPKSRDTSGNGDLRSITRSVSPFSKKTTRGTMYKDRDEDNETGSHDSFRRHWKIEDITYSPSRKKHPRNRSRSQDNDYGRRDNVHQKSDRVTNRLNGADTERNHEYKERNIHQSKLDGPEDRHEVGSYYRQKEADGRRHKERERSASYSRHEEQENNASYSRHDSRETRHSDRDRYDERRRERGRSSSISSRHDQDRRTRERERGHVRDGATRDVSCERDRERDQRDANRDRDRDRDRDRYGYRSNGSIRDREPDLDIDRERNRHNERDRIHNQDRLRDSRHSRYDERGVHKDRTRSKDQGKEHASAGPDSLEGEKESLREEDEEDYQERIEEQLAQQDEDPDKVKEESRKRRQAILEKYKQQQLQQSFESSSDDHPQGNNEATGNHMITEVDAKSSVGQPVAAELEVKEDSSDVYASDPSFTLGKSPLNVGASTPERKGDTGGLGEGTPKSESSGDMFLDDIFGESPVNIRRKDKGNRMKIERSGLHDNWDDAEGYYSYRLGEVLDGRYEVIAAQGKGVFSTVVRARDLKAGIRDPQEVAIKIIRNNETMLKAGCEELKILAKLAAADPEDRRHCVRFLSSFKYRNHLCLVFESLHMNLREVLKKFGRDIGLSLTAVRSYAQQLFVALKHLKSCSVLHCDIKPDNMLVNESKNVLKLCDFGNAMEIEKVEPSPYVVSRFYRAPEIILGLKYDYPLDMWSVGCCLYELFSGKVLFPGPSNNDMLRLHMELKGHFPKKMLKKGLFVHQHFDQDWNFHATEEDPVTMKTIKRLLLNIKPRDMGVLISSSRTGDDPKMVANFKDLLERIFILDPDRRLTVSQALSHPFITGK